jgi:hypothetical protein
MYGTTNIKQNKLTDTIQALLAEGNKGFLFLWGSEIRPINFVPELLKQS